MPVQYPIGTGAAAELLRLTEARLQALVRAGRVPSPSLLTGRRMWSESDIAAARAALAQLGDHASRATPRADVTPRATASQA